MENEKYVMEFSWEKCKSSERHRNYIVVCKVPTFKPGKALKDVVNK